MLTGFWCVDPSERVHLEDPGIDGRMILRWDGGWGRGIGWIDLAQDRDRWQVLVNAVMNFWVL